MADEDCVRTACQNKDDFSFFPIVWFINFNPNREGWERGEDGNEDYGLCNLPGYKVKVVDTMMWFISVPYNI